MDAKLTGSRIVQRRKLLGLTQKELAERIHVTDKAVSKWELGRNFPDLGLMEELAQVLDTTPAELLGLGTDNREEILRALAKLSENQMEAALDDFKWRKRFRIFWGIVLIVTYNVLGEIVGRENNGCLILLIIILGCLLAWTLWRNKTHKTADRM